MREAARRDRKLRFTALLHHVTADLLRDSYHSLKKAGCSRSRRSDLGRVWTNLGARWRELRGRIHRGSLSSQAMTKCLDPEKRWKATTIGNRAAGRQSRPARGRDRSQSDLGRGLPGLFVMASDLLDGFGRFFPPVSCNRAQLADLLIDGHKRAAQFLVLPESGDFALDSALSRRTSQAPGGGFASLL